MFYMWRYIYTLFIRKFILLSSNRILLLLLRLCKRQGCGSIPHHLRFGSKEVGGSGLMPEPILEDPYSLGKEDTCENCGEYERHCECAVDPDGAYDRMMEDL